ncbi:MAG: SURF1 family protein [Alphaproteobacteria bacterium]
MKLPFWATFFTLSGVVVLCALGTWQLHRLGWKQEILTAIDREYAIDPMTRALEVSDLPVGSLDFKRGYLIGRYQNDKEIVVQSRTYKGVPGYHILVPLTLEGQAGAILVNRGWIPIESERDHDFKLDRHDQLVTVTGILRPVPQDNAFVPYNSPDQDMWYRIDIGEIAEKQGVSNLYSAIFYVEQEGKNVREADLYPKPVAAKLRPNNNHAQYTFFWFTMACALIGVYVFRFILPTLKQSRT